MTTKTDEQERWYFLDRDGIATLCANAEDARDSASEADQLYPKNAPHVVAQIAPVAARAALQSQDREEVMEMALCESERLVLRIGQAYRFVPIAGCKACERMKAQHDEAYGTDRYGQPARPYAATSHP